jgi:type III protein arginine methyltransferase
MTSTAAKRAPGSDAAPPTGRVPGPWLLDSEDTLLLHGQVTLERGDYATAAHLLALAGGAEAGHDAVHRSFNRAIRKLVPRWHFAMLNDKTRNDAYRDAIRRVVRRGDPVLDIGTGAGLLALLAAQAGADLVVTCEAEPVVAAVARQVMLDNGVADRVRVVQARSDQLRLGTDLPRRADVLVTGIFDCALLGEGALPTLAHARRELLTAQARLVPRRAALYGQLVHSPRLYGLNSAAEACGFDIAAFQQLRSMEHFDTYLSNYRHRVLTAPFRLFEFDFDGVGTSARQRCVRVRATADGAAHAIVMWFELDMADGVTLSNSAADRDTHWQQAVQTFDQPLPCRAGAPVELVAVHDDERVLVLPPDGDLPSPGGVVGAVGR